MFAVIRTAIRVREWNRQMSKYKKLSARGQVKDAEYIQSNQGEGRITRQRVAELFPDEHFPEQMSDADLLAFLEQPEPEPETEASQIIPELDQLNDDEWIDLVEQIPEAPISTRTRNRRAQK